MSRALRLTAEQYRAAQARTKPAAKPSKHRNVKTTLDGMTFDSKKEAARYAELLMMAKSGLITYLKVQQDIDIAVNGKHVCTYIADFFYMENGQAVYEDVKGRRKRDPVYVLKRKLVHALFGITIRET